MLRDTLQLVKLLLIVNVFSSVRFEAGITDHGLLLDHSLLVPGANLIMVHHHHLVTKLL